MIFDNLPPNIMQQVFNLLSDSQYQRRLKEDELINFLQGQQHDKSIELQQLLLAIYKKNIIGGMAFKPATLALFSYLYCLKSNIVFDMSKITKEDLDIFFYLLQTKNFTSDIAELFKLSFNYGERQYNLSYNEMMYVFNKLYKIEFKVFSLFPKGSGGNEEPMLNVDWMINIVSKIKPMVSYTTEQLYNQISVSQIYYYLAHYRRMRGDNSIIPRNSQEILDEIDTRTIDILITRLIQKGVIQKQDYKKYFNLMKVSKENKNG